MAKQVEIEEKKSLIERLIQWRFYRNCKMVIKKIPVGSAGMDKLLELNAKYKRKNKPLPKDIHMGIAVKKKAYTSRVEKKLNDYIPREFNMPDSWRGRHFLCFGTTGSGKTKLMTYMLYQDILNGNDLIILNPKSDPMGKNEDTSGNELISYVVQACIQAGRLDELLIVTPLYPEHSLKLNPLKYFDIEEELIQHVISTMPMSKEAFYDNVAYEVSTAIIMALVIQERIHGKNPNINFMDIKEKVDYMALQILGDQMEYFKNYPDPHIREKINDTTLTIRQMGHSPQDFFSKISSSLRTVMTTLTSSVTGEIIGKARDNVLVERLQEGKGVVFLCNTDSVLMPRSSHIINRSLISMAMAIAGRKGSKGLSLAKPLSIYVDEGHNVLFRGMDDFFGKGRSAGIYLHIFTQSRAEIEKTVGEQLTKSILNNINIWTIMKANDPETAEYLSSSSPETIEFLPYPSGSGGNEFSITLKPNQTQIVKKDNIMALRQTFYYLRHEQNFFKGKVPFVPPPAFRVTMPEVEKNRLPEKG